MSLSARRAWIEIGNKKAPARVSKVALRKESVDRNHKDLTQWFRDYGSLSARRAWIEMVCCYSFGVSGASLSARRAWIEIVEIDFVPLVNGVALRKESVDRND